MSIKSFTKAVFGFFRSEPFEPEPFEQGSFEPKSFQPNSFEAGSFEPKSFEPEPFEPKSFQPKSFEKKSFKATVGLALIGLTLASTSALAASDTSRRLLSTTETPALVSGLGTLEVLPATLLPTSHVDLLPSELAADHLSPNLAGVSVADQGMLLGKTLAPSRHLGRLPSNTSLALLSNHENTLLTGDLKLSPPLTQRLLLTHALGLRLDAEGVLLKGSLEVV